HVPEGGLAAVGGELAPVGVRVGAAGVEHGAEERGVDGGVEAGHGPLVDLRVLLAQQDGVGRAVGNVAEAVLAAVDGVPRRAGLDAGAPRPQQEVVGGVAGGRPVVGGVLVVIPHRRAAVERDLAVVVEVGVGGGGVGGDLQHPGVGA